MRTHLEGGLHADGKVAEQDLVALPREGVLGVGALDDVCQDGLQVLLAQHRQHLSGGEAGRIRMSQGWTARVAPLDS